MKMTSNTTKKRMYRCRYKNGKCWLNLGLTTVTMMTGFTLSTMIASAQATTAPDNVAPTAQTPTINSSSAALTDASAQDETPQSEKDTGTEKVEADTENEKAAESGDTGSSAEKPKTDLDTTENQSGENDSESTADQKLAPKAYNRSISADTPVETASVKDSVSHNTDKNAQTVQTVTSIDDDSFWKNIGINIDNLNDKSVLKLASLFHIFANEASLNVDTNGNLAVGILHHSNDFGTLEESDNLTSGDIDYIQQLANDLQSNAFRNTVFNHVVFGKDAKITIDESNHVLVNDVPINNLKPDEVYQDADGSTYIDFKKVFDELIQNSTQFSSQSDSTGVKKDFSDQNNRYVDVTNATPTDDIIYVNVPFSVLNAANPISIKEINSDTNGPTIVINVTDIPDGTQNISTQVQLDYSDGAQNIANSGSHTEPNHILWNFGTENQTFSFVSGRFMGSILAPNATINAGVNIDGNIVANIVNISGGESHRWDIHPNTPPDQPTQPTQPTTPNQPTQPTTPNQPTQPTQPTTPNQPTQPTTPNQPTQPTTPNQPTQPTTPNQPTQPTTPNQPTTPDTPQPDQPTTPDTPQPDQPTTPDNPQPDQPTTPDQPEPGQAINEYGKAHRRPDIEYLIQGSESVPVATKVNKIRTVSLKGSVKAKVHESKAVLPQTSDESDNPVSILGYFLLGLGSLTSWLSFRAKRRN